MIPLRHRILRRLLAVTGGAVALALAGCGTPDATDKNVLIRDIVSERIARGRDGKTKIPPPQITRAMLAGITDPFLAAELENGGFKATLFVTSRRGPVLVWKTLDDVTLSTRNDVLIATRGLPHDLISSDPAPIMTALTGAPADARRVLRFLTGDNKIAPQPYNCDITDRGPARIIVLERSHTTRHLVESCTPAQPGLGSDFVNEYWTGQGTIWRQRVWLGPELGHIRLDRLIR